MTKPHSKFVKAVGNGGYTITAAIRFAGAGGLVAVIGAIYWAGSTAASVEQKITAQSQALREYVRMQSARDLRQDERDNRQDARLETLIQRLLK